MIWMKCHNASYPISFGLVVLYAKGIGVGVFQVMSLDRLVVASVVPRFFSIPSPIYDYKIINDHHWLQHVVVRYSTPRFNGLVV